MKLNAPKQVTWIVALVLAIVALISYLVTIPVLTDLSFWIALVGLVLMLLATYFEGL